MCMAVQWLARKLESSWAEDTCTPVVGTESSLFLSQHVGRKVCVRLRALIVMGRISPAPSQVSSLSQQIHCRLV